MTKQEYLAMSLPHELKMVVLYYENGLESCRKIKPLTGYSQEKSPLGEYLVKVGYFRDEEFRSEKSVLPICLPLSDLTKPIEHKGEKFVPLERLCDSYGAKFDMPYINESSAGFVYGFSVKDVLNVENMLENRFWRIQKLIEWHFDIACLIEKGEAIDVNTLPENPYK